MTQNVRLKKFITAGIDGTEKKKKESWAMHRTSVEDAGFTGRTDSHISHEDRTDSILKSMTLEEKIQFMTGYKDLGIHGFPRHGLPSIWCSDASAGLRCFPGGTAFPSPVSMTASWNRDLIRRIGEAIGEEFRHKGVSILLGPGVNIYRVPTCGRNFEYMGEDPYLAGKMAASYIRGAQSRGVLTTIKHLACNNSEFDRHKTDSVVDERTLREIYLPAFEMAVKEGGSRGVMSAYNPVNGVYSSENRHILTEILREEWGFEGFVISDWNSLYSTEGPIRNGLDLEMPHARWFTEKRIKKAIRKGTITEENLDTMVGRLLLTLFRAGVYDRPQVDGKARFRDSDHIALSREAAEEGCVLLKNSEDWLPLDPETEGTLVVMGRMAVGTETGGGGSSHVVTGNGVDILSGLEQSDIRMKVVHIPWNTSGPDEEQRKIIRQAEAVVFCAGFAHWEESECWDRAWDLPEFQSEQISLTASLNPNTAVILTAGGGANITGWIESVRAMVHTFYLGESAGHAVADLLFGRVNPSGKLPFTMSEHWEDFGSTAFYVNDPDRTSMRRIFIGQGNPSIRKPHPMEYLEGIFVGYRHFDRENIAPQYPFGFGLSYTEFELSGLIVGENEKDPQSRVAVEVTVKNTGMRSGAEVVQIYVRDIESRLERPEKELKGFEKIFLQPGESGIVRFSLDDRAFQYYAPDKPGWCLEPGEFEIQAGFHSRDLRLKQNIRLA